MERLPCRLFDTYDRSVYAKWEASASYISGMSVGECGATAAEAVELLQVLPFFHWTDISETIFIKAHKRLRTAQHSADLPRYRRFLQIENSSWDSIRFQEAMRFLSSFSIVKKDRSAMQSSVFSMHPLVHAWTRDRLEDSVIQESRALAIAIFGYVITESSKPEDLAFRRGLEPHIDSAFTFERGKKPVSKYRKLCMYFRISYLEEIRINARIAQVRSECFRLQDAKTIYKSVTKRLAKLNGPSDRETLRELAKLGKVKMELLELKEACLLFESLCRVRLSRYGERDPETLSSLIDLAVVYDRKSCLPQARQQLESVLSIVEDIERRGNHLNPALKDTCLTRLTIISVQLDARSVDNAHERINHIAYSGVMTPAGVMALTDFALAFSMQGKYVEAGSTWKKVFLEGRRIMGANHPIVRYAYQQRKLGSRNPPFYSICETRSSRAKAIANGRMTWLGDLGASRSDPDAGKAQAAPSSPSSCSVRTAETRRFRRSRTKAPQSPLYLL